MKVPQLDLKAQYTSIRAEAETAILRVLASQTFILGEEVQSLEAEVGRYTGAAHAIACGSGTDALLLALMALDIGPGDEVITSPFTFVSSAAVVRHLGAHPVFADIETETFGLNPQDLARKINSRTRAIVPIHLYGRMARIQEIVELANNCHIPVVEDAAQALGARLEGRMAGTFGAMGCFSFYPTKNLGGAGDGGMVVSNDTRLANRLRRLRSHGEEQRYHYAEVGLNSRLDELQAAVLRVKLKRLDGWNQARRRHAGRYTEALKAVVRTPDSGPDGAHVFHQYVVRTGDRDGLQRYLAEEGIGTAIYYPLPLHLQKCFAGLGHRPGDFPRAETVAREVLALPMYPELSSEAQDLVVAAIREWASESAAREVMECQL